jgi:chromosome segregation ATPase
MKLQHAKHVIHQHSVLSDQRLALDETLATLKQERTEIEKLPDALRCEAAAHDNTVQDIDAQIAYLNDKKAREVAAAESCRRQILDSDPALAAVHEEMNANRQEYDRIGKKLLPFTRELDEARSKVAEIAAREQERIDQEQAVPKEPAKVAAAEPTYVISHRS